MIDTRIFEGGALVTYLGSITELHRTRWRVTNCDPYTGRLTLSDAQGRTLFDVSPRSVRFHSNPERWF